MNSLSAFRAALRLGFAVSLVPQTHPGGRADGAGAATAPTAGMGAGPYSAVQVAQSFLGADLNRDGELTRAEAQRLMIAPYSFEEMDRKNTTTSCASTHERSPA